MSDEHNPGVGSDASNPAEMPARGWKQVLARSWKRADDDNISIIAAGVAFYCFLATVPLIGAAVLSYGLFADPATIAKQIADLAKALPQDVAGILADQLRGVTETAASTKGISLVVAILLAIYGSLRGAQGIMSALNIAYEVTEARNLLRRYGVAILITLGGVLAVILAASSISLLAAIRDLLPASSPIVHGIVKVLSWVVAALVISLLVALLYRYAPHRAEPKWVWITPGSILATLVWIAATLGFGFYVSNFGNYNATYGSLGAVVVFLTWLYLSCYIIIMGGELNAELERQTEQLTAVPSATQSGTAR